MSERVNRALLLVSASALLGSVGCGAPSAEEAEALNQTRQALVAGPDFVVREVSSPPSAWPNGPFPVEVTVCNQGTVAESTNVEVYLSQDRIISTLDVSIGSAFLGWLEAGQCFTERFYTNVSVPEGAWYTGAIADPLNSTVEANEANNTRAGALIGVGIAPDFVVQSVSVPKSVMPAYYFPATVTVCNQGTMGGGTEVQLVLSADTTITYVPDVPTPGPDFPMDAFNTGYLEPGQCRAHRLDVEAIPPQEGAWYVGAVADPGNFAMELIDTNNTKASEVVGVGYGTDYIVQSVNGPANVRPGESFTTAVTVCNHGIGTGSAEMMLVLSTDTTIQFDPNGPPAAQDLPLAPFYSGLLASGQCRTQEVEASMQAPSEGNWYLGAVADPGNSEQEIIETNNTKASKLVGVGLAPDYIIQSVSGPANVRPDYEFTASVTVCNQGTAYGNTEVQLVLSRDTTIRFSPNGPPEEQDLPLTSLYSGPLEPGQCRTHPVQVWGTPSQEGAWYLGAVADPASNEWELNESNNTKASKVMGVGYRPDFIIQSVSGPASVEPGNEFTASVTVCNQGTEYGSTEVQLVLSQDNDIRFAYDGMPYGQDLPLSSFHSGPLEAGQCRTHQVWANMSAPFEGIWYLGAVADPGLNQYELNEANNAKASEEEVGVGYAPDIIIQAITHPASARPGESVAFSVTACNQGTAPGYADGQLAFSEDTEIRLNYNGPPYPSQDMPMDAFFMGMLEPGQCKTEVVYGSLPQAEDDNGYVGAVLDPFNVMQELNKENNTKAGTLMGVGYRPDFIIQSVTGPASIYPGDTFTATVTVCNQGTEYGSTDVQLVLSEDSTIRFSYDSAPYERDEPIDSFYSGPLEPGQCRTEQVHTRVFPPHQGGWYLGAVADPSSSHEELIESNNAKASRLTGVGSRPDYVIQSVTGPASVAPGDYFVASVTVCNQGTEYGSTEVQLVLSEDTTIRFSYGGPPYNQDMPIGSLYSGPLEPGQCRTQQLQTSAHPQQYGGWYLGAVADPGNSHEELIESNNTKASALMGVGHGPDYVIQAVSVPASVVPDQSFTASVTVCNQGTEYGNTEVQLVLSADTDIRFSYNAPPYGQDWPVTSFGSGPLEPGQCRTEQVQTSLPALEMDRVWYLGAVANPSNYEEELIQSNNTLASKPIGVGFRPDFVIQAVSGPTSVELGQDFTASVTVCNQGTGFGDTELALVLSQDTTIRFSYNGAPYEQRDELLTFFSSGPLEPGQCNTQQVQAQAYASEQGAWYLGAVADPGNYQEEFLETNNTLASKVFGVGQRADFIIKSVTAPASTRPGEMFMTAVTVCNQGTRYGSTEVQLVLSEDSTIRFSYSGTPYNQDMPLNSFSSGPLEPGQCRTEQVQTSVYAPEDGGWYLGAVADPGDSEEELIESNNTKASTLMGVGYRPDYTVQTVGVPASMAPGQPFTVTVTVCNQGTQYGSTEGQLVLSEDTDIRFSYSGSPYTQDIPLAPFSSGPLEPGQCNTQELEGIAHAPREGAWYLGAVVDAENYEQELIETNNTKASKLVGVGQRPDFIIQSVLVPASTRTHEPFTVKYTVCNQGTRPGITDLQLVLSQDTDIRFSYNAPPYSQDLQLDFLGSLFLEPGHCSTQEVRTSIPVSGLQGGWYLGVVADPANFEQELIETNNTKASALIGIGDAPDLIIQSVTAPTSVRMGQQYAASVTVCNQGTVPGGAEVQLVLSDDTDIRFSYSGPIYDQDMPVEVIMVSSLAPGQCQKQDLMLYVTPWYTGAWYMGAIVDPGQYTPELIESNNTKASRVISFIP
ncbi:CARDB domain-containing protein [Hyalangium rubrum]|uniref:CARDB domain-containing protein n=1 Tax=Hyalangium rubrum TaxID=3103134 RepID=A0ABU5HA77_9BACT|nr:CARDB domain-containing protein [Hyalangium sp. s54d21]MDY7230220.1 CARDB domain-containing protein [Hyalangium sp. s54d21]